MGHSERVSVDKTFLKDIAHVILQLCHTKVAGVCIYDGQQFQLEYATSSIKLSASLVKLLEKVQHKGSVVLINSSDTDSSKPFTFIGVPLIRSEKDLLGVVFTYVNKEIGITNDQITAFEAQGRVVRDHFLAFSHLDVTLQRLEHNKHRLHHQEEHLQAVLDNSGDMIFELDELGKFLLVNQVLRDSLGYSEDELAGMHYTDLVARHKQKKLTKFIEGHLEEEGTKIYDEFPLVKKDGTKLWVGLKLSIDRDEGEFQKYVVVARDISAQMQITEKLNKYRNGLKLINTIASNVNFSLKEQLYMALEVGSSYLGLEVALIGQIIDDTYHVKFSQLAHPDYGVKLENSYPLKNVFSEITFNQDDVVSLSHVKESEYGEHPCYIALGMETYIGTPYYIKGKKEGTVSFFSLTPRSRPFDDNEIDFIKIFARWIGFILERERHQSSLLSEQGMLRAFASFSPAAIAMFNKDMEYVAATEKWLVENNLKFDEVIGKNHYEVVADIKEEWKENYARALKGEVISCDEDSYIDKNGKEVWLTWEVRPWYTEAHEIGGIILFTQNITVQKQQEADLIHAKEAAEAASKAKDQFLSTMSHEIRTPLNAVIGAGHLLLQEDPREDQVENLTLLKNSGEHLLSLVNDILDFNKIEEGKLTIEETAFEFPKLISSIQHSMRQGANEKNIQFEFGVDEAIPKILKGDPTRINQILINLVSNAIKFTEKGTVGLHVKLASQEKDKVRVYFEVTDSGIGITQEKLQSIFDRFTQADEDTTRKYGGSGLGLTITKKLLEMMGSEIQVDSIPGEGSRFHFELELLVSEESKVKHDKLVPQENGRSDTQKRILLVDDHEINRIMASKFLAKWGLIVDCAINGKECLDMVEGQSYDLILMDLQMPEMDGFEATNHIRARKEKYFKDLPIIALTASALVETREEVKRVGMNDYVTKPFNPKVFKNKLAIHLNDPSLSE